MQSITLSHRVLSPQHPVLIIAEAGVNHNGDFPLAKRIIDEAKAAGADCVKFQTFHADQLVTRRAPKADYQLRLTDPQESQYDMLKRLELPSETFHELRDYCVQRGLLFLSTPYGFDDVDLLNSLGVAAFKIASAQLTEYPFLDYVARKGKPLIISTGMATLDDVKEAVLTIRKTGNEQIVLLQCTTNYPSRVEEANVRAMVTMAQECDVLVGYSDHTVGQIAVLGAVALGACVIEKHFTLDKHLQGPDHRCSSDPAEFAMLVHNIRVLEKTLGSPEKRPSASEGKNAWAVKRSLVTTRDIVKGSRLTNDMLTFKRPASGIPPKDIARVLGRTVVSNLPADTVLTYEMLEEVR